MLSKSGDDKSVCPGSKTPLGSKPRRTKHKGKIFGYGSFKDATPGDHRFCSTFPFTRVFGVLCFDPQPWGTSGRLAEV